MKEFTSMCLMFFLATSISSAQTTVRNMDDFLRQCGLTDSMILSPDVLLSRSWNSKTWSKTTRQQVEACDSCDAASASFTGSGEVVWITEPAESGDWMLQTGYCYDKDGKLTRAASGFRQVTGWAVIQLYKPSGTGLLRVSEYFTNLRGDSIPRPSGAEDYPQQLSSMPAYNRIERLPFAGFLGQPKSNRRPVTDN